jgi:hypothetical protein
MRRFNDHAPVFDLSCKGLKEKKEEKEEKEGEG